MIIEGITSKKLLELPNIPPEVQKILGEIGNVEIVTSVVKREIIYAIYHRRSFSMPNSEYGNRVKSQIEFFLNNLRLSKDIDIYMSLIKDLKSYYIIFYNESVNELFGFLDLSE